MKNKIINIFKLLKEENNNINWWPIDRNYHKINNSDPRFEIIAGAILTQNTNWSNVEKTLTNLKNNKKLDIRKIKEINIEFLKELIKPSGFYNQKAERLKNFAFFIYLKYNYNFDSFFNKDLNYIRNELLSLKGIGPETADSILLYAGNKPTFVVDTYTKRIFKRLNIVTSNSYDEIKNIFEENLKKIYSKKEIIKVYQDLHAMIVLFSKIYCKKTNPKCKKCIINKYCDYKKNHSHDNKL